MRNIQKKTGIGAAVFVMLFALMCFVGVAHSVQAATEETVTEKTKISYGGYSVSVRHSGATGYTSSDTSVATVNKYGIVKPKKTGTTKITCKKGSITYVTTVKFKKIRPVITVSKKSISLDAGEDETYQLKATATYKSKVLYKSNKTSVAKVSSTGKITALKSGTATITVYGEKTTFLKTPKKVKIKVVVVGAKAAKCSRIDTYIPKSKEKYTMKVYSGAKTAALFLTVCKTVATTIVHDGNWHYKASAKINDDSFALARQNSRTATCAIYVSYCMQQFGTLPVESRIWAKHTTNPSKILGLQPKKEAGIKKYLAKYYKTIDFKGGKTVEAVDKAGKLKPGDIVCYPYHMNVYAGKNKKGVRTWYDFGSGSFNEILTVKDKSKSKIVRIYRLK